MPAPNRTAARRAGRILVLLDGRSMTWLQHRTGLSRNTLYSILAGGDLRLSTAYRIAHALTGDYDVTKVFQPDENEEVHP
jgi:DNA-binding phage protein